MSNRLATETSPYLLQHKDNPVDRFPWGEEALAAARTQEDRPIFLSIGYAACHWCHVMAHESFEDPDTAAILNEHFICIKVDREERPDLDALYMEAVIAMSGHGGWPMSVFLTPDGKPFYGGTYFPPTQRHGLPAFREVLLAIANAWHQDRRRLTATAARLADHLASPISLTSEESSLDPSVLARARQALFHTYDWTHGGWGGTPKFPQAMAIEFLLRQYHRDGDRLALDMAYHALRSMARGGIFDAVGGGFHRCAVDAAWHTPHFEKMLYDNALLARVYLHAWLVSGDPEFRRVAEATLEFLLADMRHPQGGFFSSLDADSEGQEGRYYTWTADEIREALGPAGLAEAFVAAYDATPEGNFEGRNVLHRARGHAPLASEFHQAAETVSQQLARARDILRTVRRVRIPPARDEKVLTSWNGLVLSALAEAGRALDRSYYLEAAQALAGFLLTELTHEGRLHRSWREGETKHRAYLEDHAALAEGLLALYSSDFDPHWYTAAVDQVDEILEHFADPQGGFFDVHQDHEALVARPKSIQDNATPSGNALVVTVLLHLAALTGEPHYTAAAETPLRAIQQDLARHPTAFGARLCAFDFALGPQRQLAIVGDPRQPAFQALAAEAARRFAPNLVLAGGEPNTDQAPPLLRQRQAPSGAALAYLCQDFSCQLPTDSPAALAAQIEERPLSPEHTAST
ncbi:MAG: thioredoxin domain-containing protein [Chloroflexota bacterium]